MNVDQVSNIIFDAVQVTLITSLPSITLGLIMGVIIAVFQAITQVQEQTLTFVPKLIIVLLVLTLTFSWMTRIIMEFSIKLWSNIPTYSK